MKPLAIILCCLALTGCAICYEQLGYGPEGPAVAKKGN